MSCVNDGFALQNSSAAQISNKEFSIMPHAYFWPMPENKHQMSMNDYAKHQLDHAQKVLDGPLQVEVTSGNGGSPLLIWKLEGEENGMSFTIDLETAAAAIQTALDYDRFAELQVAFEDVKSDPNTPGAMHRLFSAFTPIDDAENQIMRIEAVQSGLRKLADALEAEKRRTQKYLKEKEAERDRSDMWPPVSVDVPRD